MLSSSALLTARRAVHERPYSELPHDPTKGEAYEVARDSLLQLNIMTRRGIEPDALMYTSLINIMGRAGLEWQAYKLFSRMIEADVRPLPETYVALRDATGRQRTRLRDEIQAKIAEAVETFPDELAEGELSRQRQEDRACVAKFEDYLRGELPPPAPVALPTTEGQVPSQQGQDPTTTTTAPPSSSSEPVTTMNIRNPTDAWGTARRADQVRGRPRRMAAGPAAADLCAALAAMHEEELRIFLAANRQLRHGDRAALVERVLRAVGENAIHAMLERRNYYFRSVEQILATDLEVLKSGPPPSASSVLAARAGDRTMHKAETESMAPEVLLTPWGLIRKPLKYREDRGLAAYKGRTGHGKEDGGNDNDGDVDGVSGARSSASEAQLQRLEQVRLTAPELMLIRRKSEAGDLDELPESMLRRYAFQFRLRWRRREPLSLLNAVRWHATTFLSPNVRPGADEGDADDDDGGGGGDAAADRMVLSPAATPAIRLQREQEGIQETLENYEAFRIISQRTNNLQVVDDREINLHLKRIRRDALKQERRTEEGLRREGNILAAAGLAAAAKSFTPPPEWGDHGGGGGDSHVLGWGDGGGGGAAMAPPPWLDDDGSGGDIAAMEAVLEDYNDDGEEEDGVGSDNGKARRPSPPPPAAAADELPPWALTGGEAEFNLSTGRFGDPNAGSFQELSDGTVRVLPSREAQVQWSVDRNLLPQGLQGVVDTAELEQLRYRDSVESEYGRRRQFAKYRRWDNMIQKASSKRREAEDGGDGDGDGDDEDAGGSVRRMKPLPAKKRLAQLLRHGVEKQKVSQATRDKYNKSL